MFAANTSQIKAPPPTDPLLIGAKSATCLCVKNLALVWMVDADSLVERSTHATVHQMNTILLAATAPCSKEALKCLKVLYRYSNLFLLPVTLESNQS